MTQSIGPSIVKVVPFRTCSDPEESCIVCATERTGRSATDKIAKANFIMRVNVVSSSVGAQLLLALDPKKQGMDIKGMVADHMGHFSIYDIPRVLLAVVVAACLGMVLGHFGAKRDASATKVLALWSATAALATAIVRSQLPIAILVLAAVILIGRRSEADRDPILLAAVVIGIGCGSGASIIMVIALVPYLLLVRWALGKKSVG